jgi:hypothetical protein
MNGQRFDQITGESAAGASQRARGRPGRAGTTGAAVVRGLLVVVALAVLAQGVGAGVATATHGGQQARAYGRGVASGASNAVAFGFVSRDGSDATGPQGRMKVEHLIALLEVTAEVTCLQVVGNRATIGGRITRQRGSSASGLLFDVTDNTLASGVQNGLDVFNYELLEQVPQVCQAPTGAGQNLVDGDLTVEAG